MKFEHQNLPKGTTVQYPRTNADRDFDDLQQFLNELDDPNIVGRARHELPGKLIDYGHVVVPKVTAPRTQEDKIAELKADAAWARYENERIA